MSYVALYPFSNTNLTKKFRVVDSDEWQAVLNGEKTEYKYTEYDNINDAVTARDRLNNPTPTKDEVNDQSQHTTDASETE